MSISVCRAFIFPYSVALRGEYRKLKKKKSEMSFLVNNFCVYFLSHSTTHMISNLDPSKYGQNLFFLKKIISEVYPNFFSKKARDSNVNSLLI